MGWGRFLLLGDIGQQLDLRDQQDAVSRLRSSVEGQQRRDLQQDQQIRELQEENVELKLAVNRLANLLVSRGVLTAADVTDIAETLERAEQAPQR